MIFNSIEFLIFLPVVFALFWVGKSALPRSQNIILLVASYFFYGWWDLRFLILIMFSSAVDFYIGKALSYENKRLRRNILLGVSLTVNLGMLGYFKYSNFFIESFVDAFTFFGTNLEVKSLSLILPVGISFYTFQTLSYSIDVWKRKLKAETNIVSFFSFVSFFPQLVAGPIERAENLLPQFSEDKKFDFANAADGLKQMLWGIFKKVVIADNCAYLVNEIFIDYAQIEGVTLVLGLFLFSIQIYCDFSGYSDVAIGTAKLFGFKLKTNFRYPFFANGISDFWKRWHISLSTWFRDYVYIPLGGSEKGVFKHVRNVFVVFLVSGFWHGANLTYIFWGAGHALLFLPSLFLNKTGLYLKNKNKNVVIFFKSLITFMSVSFLWVFFRSNNLESAFEYIENASVLSIQSFKDAYSYVYWKDCFEIVFIALGFLILEFISRNKESLFKVKIVEKFLIVRWLTYYGIIFSILFFGAKQQEFIYFQF